MDPDQIIEPPERTPISEVEKRKKKRYTFI